MYTQKRLKQKLQERSGDFITFSEIDDRENIVSFHNATNYIINKAYYEERSDDPVEKSIQIIKTMARLKRTNIRGTKLSTTYYPSNNDIKSIDNNKEFIPGYLQHFLEELFTDNLCQAIIGQCIVKALPPLLFSLEIEMYHVFGLKWLIYELSYFGHSISYKEVQ